MPYLIQRVAAAIAIVALSPVIAIVAVAVRRSSPGPALHRAIRVGRHGRDFQLLKFRSMGIEGVGPAITAADDQRVTGLGHHLRSTKLDELPQLWNVIRGDMAIVGPRPEDPRYVDTENAEQREVLTLLPGLTGPTALAFADEEVRLQAAASRAAATGGREAPTDQDVDAAYRAELLPAKLAMDLDYVRHRSTRGDLRVLGRTIGLLLRRASRS